MHWHIHLSTAASSEAKGSFRPAWIHLCLGRNMHACQTLRIPAGFPFTHCHVAAATGALEKWATELSISGIQSFQMCSIFYQWGEKQRIKGVQNGPLLCCWRSIMLSGCGENHHFFPLNTFSLTAGWILPECSASVEFIPFFRWFKSTELLHDGLQHFYKSSCLIHSFRLERQEAHK